jgi:hypothetical protein
MGLLAQISPDAVATGLLSQAFPQSRRPDSVLARLAAAGIDPQSEEGQELIRQSIGGGSSKEQMDAILRMLQIQSLQNELGEARTEKDRTTATGRISTLNSIERLREIAEINARLRGTLAETGIGFNQLRSLAAGPISALITALGGDSDRARRIAQDLGRFEQLTTREALQDLFGGQANAGTITDQKLQTFLTTKPGIDQLPETNNKIIADMLQSALDSATVLDITIPDRDEVNQLIEQLRTGPQETTTETQDRNVDAELFRDFSEAFPELGRQINEADIRKTMRERGMTRAQVIRAMRRQLEERRGAQ